MSPSLQQNSNESDSHFQVLRYNRLIIILRHLGISIRCASELKWGDF